MVDSFDILNFFRLFINKPYIAFLETWIRESKLCNSNVYIHLARVEIFSNAYMHMSHTGTFLSVNSRTPVLIFQNSSFGFQKPYKVPRLVISNTYLYLAQQEFSIAYLQLLHIWGFCWTPVLWLTPVSWF